MLYQLLQDCRRRWPDHEAVRLAGRSTTYGQLADRAEQRVGRWQGLAGRPVGLALSAGADWIAAAAALDGLACRAFLASAELKAAQLIQLADRYQLAAVLCDLPVADGAADPRLSAPGEPAGPLASSEPAGPFASSEPAGPLASGEPAGPPARREPSPSSSSVVLFTSGTSGEPKPAVHTWDSLASGIKRSARQELLGERMLLAYEITRYAGLQVLLTALANGARLSVPPSRAMAAIAETLVADQVTFASGTPTFWRMLLANTTAQQQGRMPLRQITLGGEPITQPILDALRAAFGRARLTQIYASTEMGVCFSVHDGLEGFPAEFLSDPTLPVRLKIQDGQLWIRSNRGMAGYLGNQPVHDQWFNTGDAVEQRGGRVYFRGRQSGRINVGGEKVYPEEVEAVIRQAPGVAEVRVSGLASSIVGQLVQAEVVAAPGADPDALRKRISELCVQRLEAYKQPRIIRFVDNLARSDTMKVVRRTDQP